MLFVPVTDLWMNALGVVNKFMEDLEFETFYTKNILFNEDIVLGSSLVEMLFNGTLTLIDRDQKTTGFTWWAGNA